MSNSAQLSAAIESGKMVLITRTALNQWVKNAFIRGMGVRLSYQEQDSVGQAQASQITDPDVLSNIYLKQIGLTE